MNARKIFSVLFLTLFVSSCGINPPKCPEPDVKVVKVRERPPENRLQHVQRRSNPPASGNELLSYVKWLEKMLFVVSNGDKDAIRKWYEDGQKAPN